MKKVLVLVLAVVIAVSSLVMSVSAQHYTKNNTFALSKKDLTSSGKTFTYNENNINYSFYVQHWKGNALHADTARTQIKTGTDISNTNCYVGIYVNGKLNTSNSDPTFAETATDIWKKVHFTKHKTTVTGSTGNTLEYQVTGSTE